MAWATWNPSPAPSQDGTQRQMSPNMISNTFGDGYSQDVPNGINYVTGQVTVAWGQMTVSQWATIEAFLITSLTTPFLWTLPGETSPRQFRSVKWQLGYATLNWVSSVQATLKIDFTPAPS